MSSPMTYKWREKAVRGLDSRPEPGPGQNRGTARRGALEMPQRLAERPMPDMVARESKVSKEMGPFPPGYHRV